MKNKQIKLQPAQFGKTKVYDCNVCRTRQQYRTTQLTIAGNNINLCRQCLKDLKDIIEEELLK